MPSLWLFVVVGASAIWIFPSAVGAALLVVASCLVDWCRRERRFGFVCVVGASLDFSSRRLVPSFSGLRRWCFVGRSTSAALVRRVRLGFVVGATESLWTALVRRRSCRWCDGRRLLSLVRRSPGVTFIYFDFRFTLPTVSYSSSIKLVLLFIKLTVFCLSTISFLLSPHL